MAVLEPIKKRRSIREFDPSFVLKNEQLRDILEAARLSPSGTNTQAWRFVVVRDRDKIRTLAGASYGQRYFGDASCLIVCMGDLDSRSHQPRRLDELVACGAFTPEEGETLKEDTSKPLLDADLNKIEPKVIRDTAIAAYGMMLQAAHLGVGSCWIAIKDAKLVKSICGIPTDKYGAEKTHERFKLVGMLALGKPLGEWPESRPRLPLSEIAFNEQWGDEF